MAEAGFTSLQSAFGDGRRRRALVFALLLLGLLYLAGDSGRHWLQYRREDIAAGEWWRLLTGHLVHLDLRHFIANAIGLVLLWVLYANEYPPGRWIWILLASAAAIDLGLWWRDPEVDWYLGASGVLHGIWSAGAWSAARRREPLGFLSLLLLLAKLIAERWHGGSLVLGHEQVVLPAHLYGALGGLLAALVMHVAILPRPGSGAQHRQTDSR